MCVHINCFLMQLHVCIGLLHFQQHLICPSDANVLVSVCVLYHHVVHLYDCGSSDIRDCSECVTLPGELDCGYCGESGLKLTCLPNTYRITPT